MTGELLSKGDRGEAVAALQALMNRVGALLDAKSPHFPGAGSGVTIGIGYDLRFQSEADFDAHW